MTLSLKNRIKKKSDIDVLFRHKKSLRGNFLCLKVVPNNLTIPRFFIAISHKIDKRATARNRMKRILMQAIGLGHKNKLRAVDIAIIVQKKASEEELLRDLNQLLNKVQ